MGLRRKSRELALQFLFSQDFQEQSPAAEVISTGFELFAHHFEAGKKSLPYARQLVSGICADLGAIDSLLRSRSHNWRLERMSSVDRNILRMAVFEMQHCDDVPARVAINEALEIAKRYSTGESVPFINGILDAVQAGLQQKD